MALQGDCGLNSKQQMRLRAFQVLPRRSGAGGKLRRAWGAAPASPHLPGTGPPRVSLSPNPQGVEGATCNFSAELHSFFTQDLSLHGDNYVTEQKFPPIKVANFPYWEFYRGHELKATF